MSNQQKPKRTKADWERIGVEYRAGQVSIREIAREHGVSEGAVRKHAKQHGWHRDLSKAVRDRVRSKTVREEVRTPNASDEEIIEHAAERGVHVIRSHRKDILTGRTIMQGMLQELQAETHNAELYETIIDQHIDEAGLEGQSANLARRAISLPQRASTLRDLSQSMQRLIAMERQAFGLDDRETGESEIGSLLKAIDGETKGL